MRPRPGLLLSPALRPSLFMVLLVACNLATAEESGTKEPLSANRPLAVGIAWGSSSDDSNALRLSLTRPWRRRWFEGGIVHLTGYWELSVARFENDVAHVAADDGTAHLWNVALAPVGRLQFTLGDSPVQPFLDLGVGLSFMSDKEFRTGKQRSRPLGSYFQFEDRGAVGLKFGRWEIAYQRMHYSNLNLASSNHGIDAHLLLLRGAIGAR